MYQDWKVMVAAVIGLIVTVLTFVGSCALGDVIDLYAWG